MTTHNSDDFLHDIIGDIYEASINPDKWPALIEHISLHLTMHHPVANIPQGDESVALGPAKHLANILDRHFTRALNLSDHVVERERHNGVLAAMFEQLAFPAVVIDEHHQVIYSNPLAQAYSDAIAKTGERHELRSVIHRVFNEGTTQTGKLRLAKGNEETVMVTPLLCETEASSGYALLMFSGFQEQAQASPQELKSDYDLTPAEARLVNNLLTGQSLRQISSDAGTSMHTLRSQLKSIFSKTGTSRQAELVQLILSRTNCFIRQGDPSNAPDTLRDNSRLHQQIRLQDGRILGFAEYGDPQGYPVIGCHPVTGSRLQNHPDEALTRSLGIRLIVPDRPGFGLSTPINGRMMSEWGKDLEQLVDKLGIERFSLLGYCGGAPYGISAAIAMPHRVNRLVLVSPVTPYEQIDLLLGVHTANRILVNIAQHLPSTLFKVCQVLARGLVKNPDRYFDPVINHLCDSDAAALNEPAFLDNFQQSLGEALANGPTEFSNEQLMLAGEWQMAFKQVECPTYIWHGEKDKHVPINNAERLSREFTECHYLPQPDHGHFMIYHLWKPILQSAYTNATSTMC